MASTNESQNPPPQNPPQNHFANRNLPDELKLHMFEHLIKDEQPVIATKQYRNDKFRTNRRFSFFGKYYAAMAACTTTRGPYHQALGDHVMRNAVSIKVNVKDLNFTNLRAFITALAKEDELEDFATRGPGLTSRRVLHIYHHTTKALPDSFDRALSFIKFVNGLVKKLPSLSGQELYMVHHVQKCEDDRALGRLLYTMASVRSMSRSMSKIVGAFRRYLTNVRIMEKLEGQALVEQHRALREGVADESLTGDNGGPGGDVEMGEDV